jgi:ankyrin
LAEQGADVRTQDRILNPAITYAVLVDRPDIVAWFIASGADVNAESVTGYTPLIVAAGQGALHIVHLLLGAGADPQKVARRGHSALWMAEKRGHQEVAEVLHRVTVLPDEPPTA